MLKQSLFQLGWNFLVKQNAMLKFLHVWAGCWWWRWAGHSSRTPDQQQQGVNQYMSAVDNRSWHATMLPRQHNHVLRPQNFWLCLFVDYVYICWLCLYLLWLLHLDTEAWTFSVLLLVTEALLHCRVAFVAKLKNCRVPSPAFSWPSNKIRLCKIIHA